MCERDRVSVRRVRPVRELVSVFGGVVTVDIMLTSSQSSLLVSLGLWAPVSSCFTYSCLL